MALFRVELKKVEETTITFNIEAQDEEGAERKGEELAEILEKGGDYPIGVSDIEEELEDVRIEVEHVEEE